MKYLTAIVALAAVCMASCATDNSNKDNKEAEADALATLSIEGQWKLSEYNVSDSLVKVDADKDYVMTFNPDSTFNLTTDCNQIGGQYIIKDDSLKFENTFSTRMMCPDMQVEDAMNTILPKIDKMDLPNDSTLSLVGVDGAKVVFVKK